MVKTTLAELYGCERTEKWQKCSNQNWHHAFINLAGTWVQYLQQLLVKEIRHGKQSKIQATAAGLSLRHFL